MFLTKISLNYLSSIFLLTVGFSTLSMEKESKPENQIDQSAIETDDENTIVSTTSTSEESAVYNLLSTLACNLNETYEDWNKNKNLSCESRRVVMQIDSTANQVDNNSNEQVESSSKKRKNKESSTQNSKKRKISHNKEEKRFKCDVPGCRKSYNFQGGLTNHKRGIHGNGYQCDVEGCNKSYRYYSGLLEHKTGKHGEGFKCTHPGCNKSFEFTRNLADHIKSIHGDGYKCTECQRVFDHASSLFRHMKTNHKPEFPCQIENCSQGFSTSEELLEHKKSDHEISQDNLKISENIVDQIESQQIKSGTDTITPVSNDDVQQKSNSLPTVQNLEKNPEEKSQKNLIEKHIESVETAVEPTEENKQTFKCDYPDCSNSYAFISGLSAHRRMHEGKLDFKCNFGNCKFACNKESVLQTHKKRNHEKKQNFHIRKAKIKEVNSNSETSTQNKQIYKCNFPDCSCSYTYDTGLVAHNKIHKGELNFKCNVDNCKFACNKESALYTHKIRNHKGESKYRNTWHGKRQLGQITTNTQSQPDQSTENQNISQDQISSKANNLQEDNKSDEEPPTKKIKITNIETSLEKDSEIENTENEQMNLDGNQNNNQESENKSENSKDAEKNKNNNS